MWPFDENKRESYQRYAQARESGNYNSVDTNQAARDLREFAQHAPPDVQERLYSQLFSQLPPEQRAQFVQQLPPEYRANPNDPNSVAHNVARLGKEQPDVLQRILAHPLLVATCIGLAGLVAKHMLEHRER
jgi:hypothetical protein